MLNQGVDGQEYAINVVLLEIWVIALIRADGTLECAHNVPKFNRLLVFHQAAD